MENAAGANFHNDEQTDEVESGRNNNEEIACNDGFRMIAKNVIQHWVYCFRLG
jgi:hypothetical protein